MAKRGKAMGVVDAVPVNHGLREPVSNYSWNAANRQRELLLAKYAGSITHDLFNILSIATRDGGGNGKGKLAIDRPIKPKSAPRISVVLPTRDRARLLDAALKRLSRQTLPRSQFEVIVAIDG